MGLSERYRCDILFTRVSQGLGLILSTFSSSWEFSFFILIPSIAIAIKEIPATLPAMTSLDDDLLSVLLSSCSSTGSSS